MYTFIIILIIITCILLGLVVLVQNSKGGGLASGLTGSNQVMGVRKTSDFLEKLTWGLAITFICLALIANFALPRETKQASSSVQEQIDNSALPANMPSAPAPGNAAPAPAPAPAK